MYKINKIVTNFENGKTELELLNEVINFEVEFDEVVGNLIKTADSTLATVDTIRTTADAGETNDMIENILQMLEIAEEAKRNRRPNLYSIR